MGRTQKNKFACTKFFWGVPKLININQLINYLIFQNPKLPLKSLPKFFVFKMGHNMKPGRNSRPGHNAREGQNARRQVTMMERPVIMGDPMSLCNVSYPKRFSVTNLSSFQNKTVVFIKAFARTRS